MNIVLTNKFHTPIIIEMLKHYRNMSPIDMIKEANNKEYITKLLSHIYAGRGIGLLSYKDDVPTGMLLAMVDASIWDPSLLMMREIAYWVEPEYRNTTSGYRLLAKYKEIGDEMIKDGKIKKYTISKMINSPDLDYGRLKFRKIEETWTVGE